MTLQESGLNMSFVGNVSNVSLYWQSVTWRWQ